MNQTDAAILLKAQSVAFATLVMAQLIHVFDCRSSRSIFHRNPFQNRYLGACCVFIGCSLLGVMYVEALQPIFKTVPLGWQDWILVLIAAGIPTFLWELAVCCRRRRNKSHSSNA